MKLALIQILRDSFPSIRRRLLEFLLISLSWRLMVNTRYRFAASCCPTCRCWLLLRDICRFSTWKGSRLVLCSWCQFLFWLRLTCLWNFWFITLGYFVRSLRNHCYSLLCNRLWLRLIRCLILYYNWRLLGITT
jgi:hypothetical protein